MRALALTLCCSAALLAGAAQAQAAATAPQLKAQVLLKALRFVEWPAASLGERQPLQLCLLVDGSLAQELQAQQGQRINERLLQVRAVHNRQVNGCHLALVGPEAAWSGAEATLIVTEAPGLLERGAMLSLQLEEGRVVFDVGLDAARRAGLEISARLLRLARFVKKSG